ncbi:MAG: endolytic transglycosylase MltG [Acidimicrobiales bacterium]
MTHFYDQDTEVDGEADLDELEEFDEDEFDEDEFDEDDEEFAYEPLRGEMSGARKVLLVLIGLAVILLLVLGALGLWVMRRIDPPGDPGAEVRLSIPTGSSAVDIGELLESEGVITDATIWRFYVRIVGTDEFQAGDFVFRENSAMGDAIDVLEAGPLPPPFQEFTVPEGLTTPETLAAVSQGVPAITLDALNQAIGSGQVRSALQPEGAILEGFLFPETYRVETGEDALAVLTKMTQQFDTVANEVGLAQAPNPYELVIIASLIQEEAKIPEDAPKVARVIYNRLEEGIPLGIDATLCYLEEDKPCRLTESDLERDGPYNSRENTGLPPTPIAAPGRAALEAALNPADGPWLYYVLDAEAATPGGHFFTDDFDEFNAKKAECEAAGLGCG